METILQTATEYGLLGVALVLLAYDVFFLQNRLLTALQNNTAVMSQVVEVMRKCDGKVPR